MPGKSAPQPCPNCRPGESCERHCGGKLRQTEGLCQLPKGHGTDHPGIGRCKRHGGSTRNHRTNAQGEKARRAVAEFALPVEIDPHEALLDALYRRAGMTAYLAGIIAEMESHTELKQLSMGSERFERPAVWVEMYDTALKEQARVAKACVDAGIDERRTRVIERHGKELDGVLRKVLDGMMRGLTARGMPADELSEFWRTDVPGIVRGALVGLLSPPALGQGDAA